MIKQLLTLFFVPFFAFTQNSDCLILSHKSTLKGNFEYEIVSTYNLAGNIASKLETRAISGGTYNVEEKYTYNAKGYLSKVSSFQNGELRLERQLTYNDLGQLISEVEARPGQDIPLNRVSVLANNNEKLFYEFDGSVSGREVERKNDAGLTTLKELRGKENELFHSTSRTFTAKGQPLYSENIDVLGKLTEQRFWEYSNEGVLLKDSTLINDSLQGKTLYEYNVAGALIKKTGKNASNTTEYEVVYKINAAGLTSEEVFYYNDAVSSIKKYAYTGANITKEEQYNADGELLRTVEWEYNCD